jgi:hypothetical protein
MLLNKCAAAGAIASFLLLTSCAVPPKSPSPGPGGAPQRASAPEPPRGVTVYRVDPAQSELRLLVYRSGPMAHLGHNHVIQNRQLGGWVGVAGKLTASVFYLQVPVGAFTIDDLDARLQEGAEFAEPVDAEAASGTKRNMLSAALLDGDRFPGVTLTGAVVDGAAPQFTASITVTVAGRVSTLAVPFQVDIHAKQLSGTAELDLRQSALGLTPFSVMMGALRVQDEMHVRIRVVAEAT